MSSNLPLRTIRIPALRQQCLFQRRRSLQSPRAFSTTSPQAFASTSPRLRKGNSLGEDKNVTRVAMKSQIGPAPKVNEIKAQQEGAMAEDIGVLQDTIIRAGWSKLPMVWNSKFWSYMWKLLKSKGTGMYSRTMYKRCMYKKGWRSFLPIGAFKNSQLKKTATSLYTQLYANFAKGDMAPVSQHTLPPLLQSFRTRIAARGPVKMEWRIIGKPHASVMTHRASVFGEDQPDTAFRQAVIRIESTQELSMSYDDGKKGRTPKPSSKKGIRWSPSDAKKEEGSGKEDKVEFADNGKPRRVVEYLVLQRRVISGKEDTEWKAWGFAKESTPESIEDDAVYWRKMLNGQAAEA